MAKTKVTQEETESVPHEGRGISQKRLLRAVALAERLLLCRLERALLHEREIDRLIATADTLAREEGWNEKNRRELLASLGAIRCEDLPKLVGIIGILSEREREIRGEGQASGGETSGARFEDL